MGWGVELLWLELRQVGFDLGIVDAVSVDHLFWPGGGYSQAAEWARVQALLAERGIGSFEEIQRVVRRRFAWQV